MPKQLSRIFLSCIVSLFFWAAAFSAQPKPGDLPAGHQRLLLNLGARFLMVWSEGHLELDSCLFLAARWMNISPAVVINFGLEDGPKNQPGIRRLVQRGAWCLFQPGATMQTLDSGYSYLTRAILQSEKEDCLYWRDRALCLLGKYYFKKMLFKEGMACEDTAIARARMRADIDLEAYAQALTGTYAPLLPEAMPKKLEADRQSALLYERMMDTAEAIAQWMNIGYMDFVFGRLQLAASAFTRSLVLQKAFGFPYTHYTNDALALTYSITGDFAKELYAAFDAVRSSEETGDDLGLANFYLRAGSLVYGPNGKEQAVEWYRKSLAQYRKSPVHFSVYLTMRCLFSGDRLLPAIEPRLAVDSIRAWMKLFPPQTSLDRQYCAIALGEAYMSGHQFTEAQQFFLEAVKINRQNPMLTTDRHLALIYADLGYLYYLSGEFDRSRAYYAMFERTAAGNTHPVDYLRNMELDLYRMDSAEGKLPSALAHLRKHLYYVDSLNEETVGRLVVSLQAHYMAAEKEKDIQRLEAEKTMRRRQETIFRRWAMAFVLLLLSIIALLWNRYVIKKRQKNAIGKTNALLGEALLEKDELLKSKEWLLREVHHRVKNNLHTIICLLESQAEYLKGDALEAIQNSGHRIYAMSLIHQKLYLSEENKTINMQVYLEELIQRLHESLSGRKEVDYTLEVAPIELDISQAIPVALIVNEAVTNSMKYAFQRRSSGCIWIQMEEENEDIIMIIADNGVGFDVGCSAPLRRSLGLQLMQGLSDDLEGELYIRNDRGTSITLTFRKSHLEASGERQLLYGQINA